MLLKKDELIDFKGGHAIVREECIDRSRIDSRGILICLFNLFDQFHDFFFGSSLVQHRIEDFSCACGISLLVLQLSILEFLLVLRFIDHCFDLGEELVQCHRILVHQQRLQEIHLAFQLLLLLLLLLHRVELHLEREHLLPLHLLLLDIIPNMHAITTNSISSKHQITPTTSLTIRCCCSSFECAYPHVLSYLQVLFPVLAPPTNKYCFQLLSQHTRVEYSN